MRTIFIFLLFYVVQGGNFNPSTVIPYNMGVAHASATVENIVPDELELQAMAAANIKWSRCSVHWETVEEIPGQYNLSLFDQIVPLYTKYNISLIFTLYGGRNATSGPPVTQYDIEGFIGYVDAVLAKYHGYGIIWEMWNEPNGHEFWQPNPNATQYATLAVAVGAYFAKNYPTEIFVGPSISWIGDWSWDGKVSGALQFLQDAVIHGLLGAVDALSFHPYRGGAPETILYPTQQSWFDVRMVLLNYTSKIPRFLQTEMGWDTEDHAIHNETKIQAQFLARSFLADMSQDIAPMLWYEWQNEESCGSEYCGMGLIEHREPGQPIVIRETYAAFQTLTSSLFGYTVLQNLTCFDNLTYGLAFQHAETPSQIAVALWNTRPYMHHVNCTFLSPNACFNAVTTLGASNGKICSDENSQIDIVVDIYDVNYLIPV